MAASLDSNARNQLFLEARTQNDWHPEPLDEGVLQQLYDLLKMGPSSANCSPARFVFCTSAEARERLAGFATGANGPKIQQAPVTAIIGMDMAFADHLPRLFPHADAKSWFTGNTQLTRETAFRNSSLQGAWLMMAARTLGLDTGAMSGFDKAAVDAEFWRDTSVETNFLCSLGHGTGEKVFPRLPRFDFDEICRIA
jgi:3-hydroxypropanoate dehydrogenase